MLRPGTMLMVDPNGLALIGQMEELMKVGMPVFSRKLTF
jgi:hypothetical protein